MSAGDIEGLKKCITNREVQLKGTNRAKTTAMAEKTKMVSDIYVLAVMS